MKLYEWVTRSSEETASLAEKLASYLTSGTVITLEGDLGAGKTTFTKGLAKGLGIKKTVSSPTFTIIKEYHGNLPLYHMDVYRVQDSFEELGLDEYFEGDGVIVVEWAHLIQEQLPEEYLDIRLFYVGNEERKITLTPKGRKYEKICEELVV